MKNKKFSKIFALICLMCFFSQCFGMGISFAKTKTVNKEINVLEGGACQLPDTDTFYMGTKCKVKVADEGIVRAAQGIKESVRKLNSYIYGKRYDVIVYGEKTGTTTVEVEADGNKYIYTVNVLPHDSVKSETEQALAPKLAEARAKEGCIYVYTDLNGDDIEDLFVDGNIYLYDYYNKKLVEEKVYIKQLEKVDSIYTSKSSNMFYINTGFNLSEPNPPENTVQTNKRKNTHSGNHMGIFFAFDQGNLFQKKTDVKIIKYKYPKYFVPPKKLKKSKNFYCIDDETYDQDDLWYQSYTEKKMRKYINDVIPDKVAVFTK